MNETAISRARQRAKRLYRSPGFRGAYVAGARAAHNGLSADACPYKRGRRGGWLAWRKAWLRGYESIDRAENTL